MVIETSSAHARHQRRFRSDAPTTRMAVNNTMSVVWASSHTNLSLLHTQDKVTL